MKITILRGPGPDECMHEATYELPDMPGISVSNALQYISRNIDGSVGYYLSCRRGMCAACVVRIRGRNEMACVTPVSDGMVITPTKMQLLVKDTVVHLGMPKDCELDLSASAFRASGDSTHSAEHPQSATQALASGSGHCRAKFLGNSE